MQDIARFLPWQTPLASEWLGRQDRFAHAWLVHGLPGIGKRQFIQAAAASLLCEARQAGLACGRCEACVWLAAGNHPDLRLLRPDAVAAQEGGEVPEDTAGADATAPKKALSRDIRIEQLRSLHDWFNTATHRGGWRVAVLYPAEALNGISANALLKVLEEPPEHTIFLIAADAPDRLLPTLVSRCRRLPLPVPAKAQCAQWLADQGIDEPAQWLAAAGGAPLLALQLAQSGETACPEWLMQLIQPLSKGETVDIGPVADLLEKQPAVAWVDVLQRFFVDLILAASGAPVRYFPSMAEKIAATAQAASLASLSETARWLSLQRAVADHPLNAKLLTHSALQRVALACRTMAHS